MTKTWHLFFFFFSDKQLSEIHQSRCVFLGLCFLPMLYSVDCARKPCQSPWFLQPLYPSAPSLTHIYTNFEWRETWRSILLARVYFFLDLAHARATRSHFYDLPDAPCYDPFCNIVGSPIFVIPLRTSRCPQDGMDNTGSDGAIKFRTTIVTIFKFNSIMTWQLSSRKLNYLEISKDPPINYDR